MAYNAAAAFLILGIGLLLALSGRGAASRVAAALVGLIGGLTLFEWLTSVDLRIDELFLKCYINSGSPPYARMAFVASICFILCAVALAKLSEKRATQGACRTPAALGGLVVVLGIIGVSGYVTGAAAAYRYGSLTQMALHTAVAFIVLGLVFITTVWRESIEEATGWPTWIPLMVGYAGITVTVVIWQTLVVHQSALNASLYHDGQSSAHLSMAAAVWTERLVLAEELASGVAATILLVICTRLVQSYRRQARIRERAENELRLAQSVLEDRVAERTAELAKAHDEVQLSISRMQAFVTDVLGSVTSGRLRIVYCPSEMPPLRHHRIGQPIDLSREGGLSELRDAVRNAAHMCHFPDERLWDLLTAAGEAGMNAIVHATCGVAEVRTDCASVVQVIVRDHGTGIDMKDLPRATLERGYTTAGTLGHGIKMMLQTADCTWLLTGETGTTVIIEQSVAPASENWMSVGWLDVAV
jgi:anti-sigma regulatory factor (Ser/Thr protein kinase)